MGVILLDVDSVAASRPGRPLFADVSFTISDQDRLGIVGLNGCGKSTLLRIISGEISPEAGTVRRLAKLSDLTFDDASEGVGGYAVLSDGTGVFVPLGDAIDVARECERLGTELARLEQLIASQEKKLGNEQFVSRAPAAVVENERTKLASWKEQAGALRDKRAKLGC